MAAENGFILLLFDSGHSILSLYVHKSRASVYTAIPDGSLTAHKSVDTSLLVSFISTMKMILYNDI
jgi:hypothetical protein